MAILIDPPLWPAHGTLFSHLISDDSLAELHEFARRAGLPERAFDEDHYDVPAARYDELVAAGAQPVSGTRLIRVLRASGLRVPARARRSGAIAALEHNWLRLLPQHRELGARLLQRWNEPHRHYHGPAHLLAVLQRLRELARHGGGDGPGMEPSRRVQLAAWFHDAVYDGLPGDDEDRSAELARSLLTDVLGAPAAAEVAALVLSTKEHRLPAEFDGDLRRDAALLLDADLGVLASSTPEYDRYVRQVRADYAHVDDVSWARGRAGVLDRLLSADPLFHTEWAAEQWTGPARANLRRESMRLG